MRQIRRETGAEFRRINAPTSGEVMTASAEQAAVVMDQVSDELLPYFTPTAEKLFARLEEARQMGALSGDGAKVRRCRLTPPSG